MLGVLKKISLLQCVMVIVAAVAIWRPIWLKDFCKEHIVSYLFAKSLAKGSPGEGLFTIEELSKYTGANGSKGLYIAIMGTVYDVEKGRKHYGPGGAYHFFAGRDATTSFITGEFEQVTADLDDVLQLAPRDLLSVIQWQEFYNKEYKQVGKLIGRFYDSGGGRTKYFGYVEAKIQEAREEQKLSEKVKEEFPACNTEWSADRGTTFWCTTRSGGKERDWVGVPRKYYEAGRSEYRCACIHPDRLDSANLKEFPGCEPTADKCVYKFDEATGSN
uniref:Putative heme/steroid binding protein n=1 Tax=Phlebotomus kandelakii TaxID=1109342 RepID=A0A6B2ED60_9DIPT